jgi:hypothetical protein
MSSTVLERPTRNGRPDPTPAFNRPAYHYVRAADRLPTPAQIAGEPDPLLRVKLFGADMATRFWIAAYDPATRLAYGVVEIHERESGDFSLAELCELRGRLRLPLERDLDYRPQRLSEVLRAPFGSA